MKDDDDDVAWVALELQKKALHRLLYRMDQDDTNNKRKTTTTKQLISNSSSSNSGASTAAVRTNKSSSSRRDLKISNSGGDGNSTFRKSFTVIEQSSPSSEEINIRHQENNDLNNFTTTMMDIKEDHNEKEDDHSKKHLWKRVMAWIGIMLKSPNIVKSLGWISISSLATISLIKFMSTFLALFTTKYSHHMYNNSGQAHSPITVDNHHGGIMEKKKPLQSPYMCTPPLFPSIDDDIPRSVKGRFYLHELSTLQEQFENDGVYGLVSTSESSSSRNHLEEGPLFVPITKIEHFQEQRQKTKYQPSDIDGDINKNGLFGQMVQLESYRKSSLFNGD